MQIRRAERKSSSTQNCSGNADTGRISFGPTDEAWVFCRFNKFPPAAIVSAMARFYCFTVQFQSAVPTDRANGSRASNLIEIISRCNHHHHYLLIAFTRNATARKMSTCYAKRSRRTRISWRRGSPLCCSFPTTIRRFVHLRRRFGRRPELFVLMLKSNFVWL